MTNKKKPSIGFFKNLVKSRTNIGTMVDSIKNAFEINPSDSISWFEELSSEKDIGGFYYVKQTLFELLIEIAKKDKKSAVKIFNNLLQPKFIESPGSVYFAPYKIPQRDTMDFHFANENIIELLKIAPKEFLETTTKLVLNYRYTPKQIKKRGIQDVHSSIWYTPESRQGEIELLQKIENECCDWARTNDPKLKKILPFLKNSKNSLTINIFTNILLSNPKVFHKELFELTSKIVTIPDCVGKFAMIIISINNFLTKSEIAFLNKIPLNAKAPLNLKKKALIRYQKFLAESIPEKLRTKQLKMWLREQKEIKSFRPNKPPVTIEFESISTKKNKVEFTELNEFEQENEILHGIDIVQSLNKKNDKLDFLKNVENFLNKEKSKIKKNIILKLEPIIWKFCKDSDPIGENLPDDEQIKNSLISYPTIRASAASCLLRLCWHNPTKTSLELVKKMSQDRHSFVREEVTRNLRYISSVDYELSYGIAKKFLEDNRRVHFFLTDFLKFNLLKYPDDIFYLSEKIIKKYGKSKINNEEDPITDFVVSLITHMAIKVKNKKFNLLFKKLLDDESYNYEIKRQIAFICKDEEYLFNEKFQKQILKIYENLISHKNAKVRSDAEFFLLHPITEKNESFLPEIQPILEKISKNQHDLSSDDIFKLNIIEYLIKFWECIPEHSVIYLHRIYSSNPKLAYNFHRSRDVIKLIEKMYQSDLISDKHREKVMWILLEFVKAGWPEANSLLNKLEQSSK